MTVRKVADIIIRSSPNGRADVTGNGTTFYSYDKSTAAIDFHIQNQDGSPTDLINVDIKLLLLTKENGEWKEFTMLDGVETMSEMKGLARYIIPDELRGYVGIVEGYAYLNFNDGSRSDECHFNFKIERSRIEEEFEHAGEYYIKEIQDSLDEVVTELKEYAAKKLEEYDKQLSQFESKLTNTKTIVDKLAQDTTSIEEKQKEILKLISDNEIATKADLEVVKEEASKNVVYQVINDEEIKNHLDSEISDYYLTNLGNVDNYGTATKTEAEIGGVSNKFITPLGVKQQINKRIATQEEANDGTSTDQVITPKTLKGYFNMDISDWKPLTLNSGVIAADNSTPQYRVTSYVIGDAIKKRIEFRGAVTGTAGTLPSASTQIVITNLLAALRPKQTEMAPAQTNKVSTQGRCAVTTAGEFYVGQDSGSAVSYIYLSGFGYWLD